MEAIESNYQDRVLDMQQKVDQARRRRLRAEKRQEATGEQRERNELEEEFVDCIEYVRSDIMKRRLKNEIVNKKKFKPIEENSEEGREFEESLVRLAHLAKSKIKVHDFTSKDKTQLLDKFVNSEKTLMRIYEALFPPRDPGKTGSGQYRTVSGADEITHTIVEDEQEGRDTQLPPIRK